MKQLFVLFILLVIAAPSAGQEDALAAVGLRVEARQDAYGQSIPYALGHLVNHSGQAYTNLSLLAEVYDAQNTLIGEGIGYLINVCGAGLLPDFALQPHSAQPFEIQLELYESGIPIDHIDMIPQGIPTTPLPAAQADVPGIQRVSNREVIEVEWLDDKALRFGVGCPRDPFTNWDWFQYSSRTGQTASIAHPHAADVTGTFLRQLGLINAELSANASLSFAPGGSRVAYQGETNQFYTAEEDGRFVRRLYTGLFNRTLQGIYWLPDGETFVSYYYGANSDPVIYFTADSEGRPISLNPRFSMPSSILPGISPDGRRAVIGGAFSGEGENGYYLKALINDSAPSLLFEAEPPANNWPAPLFRVTNGDTPSETIYIARPVLNEARLQCFSMVRGGPFDLAPLPLALATEDRARWWLSPDGSTIALAANGVNGGLWLIDLNVFGECGG